MTLPKNGTLGDEDKRTIEERMTTPTFTECLSGFTERAVRSKRLTDADLQKLRDGTAALGAELDRKRLAAIDEIRTIPEKARADPRVLDASTVDQRYKDIIERASGAWTPEQRAESKERWFNIKVQSIQRGIAANHWSESGDAIRDFYWSGVWPRINIME
jgi:hypothetical protein